MDANCLKCAPPTLQAIRRNQVSNVIEQTYGIDVDIKELRVSRGGEAVFAYTDYARSGDAYCFTRHHPSPRRVASQDSLAEIDSQYADGTSYSGYAKPNIFFNEAEYVIIYEIKNRRLIVRRQDGLEVFAQHESIRPHAAIIKNKGGHRWLYIAGDTGRDARCAQYNLDTRERKLIVELPAGTAYFDRWSEHVMLTSDQLPIWSTRRLVDLNDPEKTCALPSRISGNMMFLFMPDSWFCKYLQHQSRSGKRDVTD